MHRSEYKNTYSNEESHFYYRGCHFIILSLLKKILKNKKKLQILDAGCGTGLFTKKLELFGKVKAVDNSTVAIGYAQKRGVSVIHSSIIKLPYKSNQFDIVVSLDVLYHQSVPSDYLALKELNRVLKPKGLLVLKLPAFNWLRTNHDNIVKTRKRYRLQEVETELKKLGFRIVLGTYLGSFLLLPVIIKKGLESIFRTNPHSSIRPIWIPLNLILFSLFKLELLFINRIPLPLGITLILISRKSSKKLI